ncbi:MAG: hypothetical protein V3T60_09390 [Candidatus Binatia bacterium]
MALKAVTYFFRPEGLLSRGVWIQRRPRGRKAGILALSRKLDLRKDDNKLLKEVSQYFD